MVKYTRSPIHRNRIPPAWMKFKPWHTTAQPAAATEAAIPIEICRSCFRLLRNSARNSTAFLLFFPLDVSSPSFRIFLRDRFFFFCTSAQAFLCSSVSLFSGRSLPSVFSVFSFFSGTLFLFRPAIDCPLSALFSFSSSAPVSSSSTYSSSSASGRFFSSRITGIGCLVSLDFLAASFAARS